MTSRTICIDTRMSRSSGIGTYLQGLLAGLAKRSSTLSFAVTQADGLPPHPSWPVYRVTAPIYSLREQIELPLAMRALKSRVLHSPHYNMSIACAARSVVTVHDLIHLRFPEFLPSPLARAYAHLFFYHVVPRARAILTVSDHTKQDLIERLKISPDKITVAAPGVPEQFRPMTFDDRREHLRTLGIPEDYFLYVGNIKEFKNVPFLVKAYQALKSRRPNCPALVVVGRNFIPDFERTLTNEPSLHWLPNVSREQLPALYSGATAFVFPSLYEGFGFPPLEAMACGCPVICSARASLPEVVGDAALLIDPLRLDDLIDAMDRLCRDQTLRKTLSEKGLSRAATFTWNRLVERTLAVYEGAAA